MMMIIVMYYSNQAQTADHVFVMYLNVCAYLFMVVRHPYNHIHNHP